MSLDFALEQVPEGISQSDTTDPTPGNNGTLSTTNINSGGFDVTYTKATDNESLQTALVYYLYTSTSNNLTTDASTVETNGTLQNAGGTTDTASITASGLNASTTYYFNVVVEDEAGNKAIYTSGSEATLASGGAGLDSKAGDEQALADFYVAMDGPNWDNKTGWSSDPANIDLDSPMFGVFTRQVDVGNGLETRVDILNLSGGSGQLNDDSIIGNNLTGSSVPDSFGNLKQMRELRLKGNNITAQVDNWIQSLTSIEILSLNGGTGYGGQREIDIDDRVHYNHPSKNNNTYNKWSGPLPDDLSMLTNLDYIELMGASITGQLPTQLPNGIRGLFLSNNKMTGTLPSWSNCVNMTHLYLGTRYDSDGAWSGSIPSEWNGMTQMAWLSLETTAPGLTGTVPTWDQWVDLRYYELTGHSGLDSQFPSYLFTDPNKNDQLHTLDVGGTSVYGTLPATTYNIGGFSSWSVTNGTMTGDIPASFVTDAAIIQINVRDNTFDGNFADIDATRLRWVQAENNSFQGSLPALINPGSSTNFTHMRFYNNQFTGDIPSSYGQITASNFSTLQLDDNLLDGNIPTNLFGNGWTITLQDNKYTPKNLVPILGENLSGVTYLPQKPFGNGSNINQGNTIDLSSFAYTDNSYTWEYSSDGGSTWSAVSGETGNTLDTTGQSLGLYRMTIDHPSIAYTFTSEEFNVI